MVHFLIEQLSSIWFSFLLKVLKVCVHVYMHTVLYYCTIVYHVILKLVPLDPVLTSLLTQPCHPLRSLNLYIDIWETSSSQ